MDHLKRKGVFNLMVKRLLSAQEGAVLIGLIITFTLVVLMGAALFSITVTSTFNELFAGHQSRAYYMAESGGRYAIPRILQDHIQAETNLNGKTFTLGNGDKFMLSIDNTISPDISYLESEGIVREGGWLESRVKITYKIPRPYSFEYGVFSGPGKITLRDDAYVDSYDSSIAPWSEATRRENGTVGTNRTGNRSIDLRNRTTVFGDAYVGLGGNPAAHIKVA